MSNFWQVIIVCGYYKEQKRNIFFFIKIIILKQLRCSKCSAKCILPSSSHDKLGVSESVVKPGSLKQFTIYVYIYRLPTAQLRSQSSPVNDIE